MTATRTLAALVFLAVPTHLLEGSIPFDAAVPYRTGSVPEPLAIGDLDRDGILDVVIANSAASGVTGGDSVTVLLGAGSGAFIGGGEHRVGKRPEGIVLADLNLDGALDVATANFDAESISILLGTGAGGFLPETRIAVPGGPRAVVSADFNGDRVPDLATANHDGDSVSILLGAGDGSFALIQTIPVGDAPEMLAAGYLDADGIVDLVTCDTRDDTLTLLQGLGDGSFSAAGTHAVSDLPRALLLADLDRDGLDDVIVANSGSGDVTVERNLGAHTLSRTTTLTLSINGESLRLPVGLALSDVDGDGASDLLVAWGHSRAFSVFPRGSDPFSFGSPSAVQTGSVPVGIAAADLDRDGDSDVIVTAAGEDRALVYLSSRSDPGLVIDNGDPGTSAAGSWEVSAAQFPAGADSLFSKSDAEYTWQASLAAPGIYEVSLWWTVRPGRSTAVPVDIAHAEGSARVLVDQSQGFGTWHSLGEFLFVDSGAVRVNALRGSETTCADAVRFRMVSAWYPGTVEVLAGTKPDDVAIDRHHFVAFHGRFHTQNIRESETWRGLSVRPVGPGEEALDIAEVALYLDSNSDGRYDEGDRRVGRPIYFSSETGIVTLDGFAIELLDQGVTGFFLVATKTPPAVARWIGPSVPQTSLAGIALLGLILLCRRGSRSFLAPGLLALVLLPLVVVPGAGCAGGGGESPVRGGDGGGGGIAPPALQIEVSSAFVEGTRSGIPAVVQGLPARGWEF